MLIIPSILESFASLKDKTIKVVFHTNELTPEQLTGIALNTQKFGYLAFKEDPFKQAEKDVLNKLESEYQETGKTKAQRLRAVLYRYFEQDPKGYEVFDDFYNHYMEKLINHYKNKLEQ